MRAAVETTGGALDVGILKDEVGVASAKFEDALFQVTACGSRYALPRRNAARQRHRRNGGICDKRLDVVAWDQQSAEHICGKTSLPEHILDGERASGHVARMFEDGRVARHQRRRGEAENLPEREIPRHDREDRAERIERHEGFRPVPFDRLTRQHTLGMIGEVIAVQGAFLDLAEALGPGLSHLGGHERGKLLLAAAQTCSRGLHHLRTLAEGRLTPVLERFMRPARDGERLLARMAVIGAQELPGCRIVGLEERPATIGVRRGMRPRFGARNSLLSCRPRWRDGNRRLRVTGRPQAVVTSARIRSAS